MDERTRTNRHIALLILCVFALFYCGNTLFVHTHNVGDHPIAHSHPYLPSGHHSHAPASLELISAFNSVITAMDVSVYEPPMVPCVAIVSLSSPATTRIMSVNPSDSRLRAPPHV